MHADFQVVDAGGGLYEARPTRHYFGAGHADVDANGDWTDQAIAFGNQIGSTELLVDANGQVTQDWAYTAFGEPADLDGPGGPSIGDSRYRYAGVWGYQTNPQIGAGGVTFPFLHVGARWYDPEAGRFLQGDPIGIEAGLNVYEYVFSHPTRGVDVLGFGFWDGSSWSVHDWVARNFWMRIHGTKTLAEMSDTRATAEGVGASVAGGIGVYYCGRYRMRWLNRGPHRLGKSGPFRSKYYFSYRSPKVPHWDIFRIPDWFLWKIW